MSQTIPSSIPPQTLIDNVIRTTFPPQFHFSTHLHRAIELLICQSGSVVITIQGTPFTVHAGEYLVLFPDIPHSANMPFEQPSQALQAHFHVQAFCHSANPAVPEGNTPLSVELSLERRKFFQGKSSPQLEACLEGLYCELKTPQQNTDDMIRLYLAQLGMILSRGLLEHTTQAGRSVLYDNPHLVNAALYISDHYMEKMSVNDVAAAVGVSARYLTKLFQEHLNLGVSTYIIRSVRLPQNRNRLSSSR